MNISRSLTMGIAFVFLLTLSTFSFAADYEKLNATVTQVGTIIDKKINEASGIVASRTNKNLFWVLNDSGNKPYLYGINSKGELLCTLKSMGVKNHDWEDIAAFRYKGVSYILIADIGDNRAKRKKYRLHFMKEPNINEISKTISLRPAWSTKFTYEDGARDCESIAVDVTHKKILLLSKRDTPPVLYELPLKKKDKKAVAKRVGLFKIIPQPTAMDIAADGHSAVVLTYHDAYYFHFLNTVDWSEALLSTPKKIQLPYLRQGESICFDAVGKSIYITSEKVPAPLLKVDIK